MAQTLRRSKRLADKAQGEGDVSRPSTAPPPKRQKTLRSQPTAPTRAPHHTAQERIRSRRVHNSETALLRLPVELQRMIYVMTIEDEIEDATRTEEVAGSLLDGTSYTALFDVLVRHPPIMNVCHFTREMCLSLFTPTGLAFYSHPGRFYEIDDTVWGPELGTLIRPGTDRVVKTFGTVKEARDEQQSFLDGDDSYMTVGIVTWHKDLHVRPMWFAGQKA